jgi:hypothetical protein
MKRKLAMTAVLAVALAVTGYAQKPDFSGDWTPDTAAATPPAGGGGGGGGRGMAPGPMTVKQTGDTLTIERTAGENKIVSTYKLDGTESINKMMGRGGEVETKSTAKWDGSKLTVVTKQAAPDGSVRESSQSWWLEGGNLVVESTRTGREGAPVTAKTVYKKTT